MTQSRETRSAYPYFHPTQTRWSDNDLYGHVNNAVYYSYFDTAVNLFLIEEGGFDPHGAEIIGISPETHCNFFEGVRYPDRLEVGIRVGHLGRSSVRYEVGIFKQDKEYAAANGHFVHVFVERATHRPVPIPKPVRAALARIQVTDETDRDDG